MKTLGYTKHGQRRANQRGFRSRDIDLICQCGSRVEDRDAEAYLLLDKDVANAISARKKDIQRLERLRGCKVVIADNELVTVHRANRACQRATIRRLV